MASWAVAGWACGCQTGGGLYGRTLLETHVSCRVSHTAVAAHAGRGGGQVRPHGGARRRPCPGECSMTARRWGAGMIVACVPVPRSAIPGNDYLGIILPIPDPAVRVPVKVPVPPTHSHAPHRGRAIVLRCGVPCREATPTERSGRVTAGPDPAAARAAPPAGRTDGCRARGAGGAGRTTRERGDGRRAIRISVHFDLVASRRLSCYPRGLANIQLHEYRRRFKP